MVPTTCSGRSASTASRRRAPAVSDVCDMVQPQKERIILYGRRGGGPAVRSSVLPAGRMLGDAYHRTPRHAALQIGGKRLRQLVKGDGARDDALKMAGLEVGRDALPHRKAPLTPRGRGVDPDERNAAQDEGHHRGLQLRTCSQTDAGDASPEIHRACEPGERLAAEIVDGAAETHGLQRPRAELDVLAGEHLAGAQPAEGGTRLPLAADRHYAVTAHAQHVDGDAADAARGAGDRDRTAAGLLAVLLHAVDGQSRGEPGGADGHGGGGIQSRRHRDDPLAGHPCELGVAAVVRLGQPAAGHQHGLAALVARIARGFDGAGQVDATDERVAAQDLARPGCGQRVLVVDARVADPDHHLARRQVIERDLLEARHDLACLGMNPECLEPLHDFTVGPLLRASQAIRPWVLSSRSPSSSWPISASDSVTPWPRARVSHSLSMSALMPAAGRAAPACERAMRVNSTICSFSETARRAGSLTRLKCMRYIDSGWYSSMRSMEAMSCWGSNCVGGVVGMMKGPRSVSSAR